MPQIVAVLCVIYPLLEVFMGHFSECLFKTIESESTLSPVKKVTHFAYIA